MRRLPIVAAYGEVDELRTWRRRSPRLAGRNLEKACIVTKAPKITRDMTGAMNNSETVLYRQKYHPQREKGSAAM
jgi:hypothetical protein